MNHSFPRRSVHLTKHESVRNVKPALCNRIPYRTYISSKNGKVSLDRLLQMKKRKEPITMITCYDTSQALLADVSRIDTVLVGDSCANVMMGLQNTNQITLDAMIHHTQSVSRGINRAYLIADMPFGTYLTTNDAVRNASRLIGEGGASCVKLEGYIPDAIREISRFVPVCGHLGLLPQTADGFATRGRTYNDIKLLAKQALDLQDAGASFLVLEKVCAETASYISQLLDIPTIGIGSGPHCDGQVLVWHDMLGIYPNSETYKFVKRYTNLAPSIVSAITDYIGDVKDGSFPAPQHSYYLGDKTRNKLKHDMEIWDGLNVSAEEFFNAIKDGNEYCYNNENGIQRSRYIPTSQRDKKYTKIIKSASEIRDLRKEIKKDIIFVPFLGGLHEGHLALINEANKYGSTHEIWCSLFLNPTQFNDIGDYLKYPYDMNQDIEALTKLEVDVIFTPTVDDMYPWYDINTNSNNNAAFGAYVDFENICNDCDEGKQRPGHFKGVGTVVTKLFAWIRPHKSIFGQKDFMQCIIIKNLCKEFFPDTDIIVHQTMREIDGLAMSSRNDKLTVEERKRAPLIYECLSVMACYLFDKLQKNDVVTIKSVKDVGENYAKYCDVELEYVSLHSFENGIKLENVMRDNDDVIGFIKSNEIVISIAGCVGTSTRLIDNVVVGGKGNNKTLWEGIKYMPFDKFA